jgi:membrane associated rhomboid family serine protease
MFPLRDDNPRTITPIITITLIAINSLVFFYQLSLGPRGEQLFVYQFGAIPSVVVGAESLPPTVAVVPPAVSLFTSMFLHGGWMHLIGNMWFLWIFGDNVEDILGHGKYLMFYLLCGIAAALTHVALNADSRVPTVGASGAIAGVMGAYMVKFPRARVLTLVPIFIFITFYELPAFFVLAYWFVIQIFSGVGSVAYSQVSEQGVAWFAHVGGFVAGMLLITALPTTPPYSRRRELHW